MATRNKSIREGVKIVFADGVEREVFPVSIKNMRKMMKIMKGLDQGSDEMSEEQLATLVAAARVVLSDVDPVLVKSSFAAEEKRAKLLDEGKEDEAYDIEDPLEDVLDVKTANQVLGAGLGADPNL